MGESEVELTIGGRADVGETGEIGFVLTPAPERKVRGIKVKVGG